MSLRSLLPIGRTLDRSEERSGRFRPAEPGLLPDFSRDDTEVGDTRHWKDVRVSGEDQARQAARVENRGVGAEDVGKDVGGGVVRGTLRDVKRGGAGWRLPLWLERLLVVLMRPGNRRRGSREVQGEFFLQTVKVVKNDLVTSDVEVVRTAARPKPMSASCRARLMALWWAPVARRLGRWGNRTDKS